MDALPESSLCINKGIILPTPTKRKSSLPMPPRSPVSNIHHTHSHAGTPHQQHEPSVEHRKFVSRRNSTVAVESSDWSGTKTITAVLKPIANRILPLAVPKHTDLVDSSTSRSSSPISNLRTKESPNTEDLDAGICFRDGLQHKQPAPSNYELSDSRQILGAATKHYQAPADIKQGNELITCDPSPKEIRTPPDAHPIETLGSNPDTLLGLQTLPSRIKIGSNESTKYGLRKCEDEAGLYYSSTIWPEELPHRNRGFVFGRLRTDLNNYIKTACQEKKTKRAMKKHHITLTEQAFTIELRLSGRLGENAQDIQLASTIWVICASGFYKTLVQNAFSQCQLSWISDELIEVVKGLNFNKRREHVMNLDLSEGFHFKDSYKLHLHIEGVGRDNSAVGLFVCATLTKDESIIDQCVSRLGGLVRLDKKTVAITTAHGILDMLISAGLYPTGDEYTDLFDTIPDSDTEREAESDITTGTDPEESSRSVILEYCSNGLPKSLETSIVSHITQWNVVPKALVFHFIQAVLPGRDKSWALGADAQARDFALFELELNASKTLKNSYYHESIEYSVTNKRTLSPSDSEEILILLGYNTFVRGRILPSTSTIYLGGVDFNTKRVLLDSPLAPGTSGSWVVSRYSLRGIIIASYRQEPIAHMITVQQLFYDIKSSLPQLSSIRLPPKFPLTLAMPSITLDPLSADIKWMKPPSGYQYPVYAPRPRELLRYRLPSKPYPYFPPYDTEDSMPWTLTPAASSTVSFDDLKDSKARKVAPSVSSSVSSTTNFDNFMGSQTRNFAPAISSTVGFGNIEDDWICDLYAQ